MKKSLKEKLIEYLEYKGYKKSNIQDLTGVSKTLFSGVGMNQGLSEPILMRIIHSFPDLNLNWWFRDEGNMIDTRYFLDSKADCPGAYLGQSYKKTKFLKILKNR